MEPFLAPMGTPRFCLAGTCPDCRTDRLDARAFGPEIDPADWQHLLFSAGAMASLRHLAVGDDMGSDVSRLTDHEVLTRARRLLAQGGLRLCNARRTQRARQGLAAGAAERRVEPPPPTRRRAEPREVHWIEIRLVDEEQLPAARERYAVRLPDGSLREGRLDHNGCAYLGDIPAGSCQVSFPEIDAREWRAA